MNLYCAHPNHEGDPIDYPGIFIQVCVVLGQNEFSLCDLLIAYQILTL